MGAILQTEFSCVHENGSIFIEMSLKFVFKDPFGNKPALAQIMAWRHSKRLTIVVCYMKEACESESPKKSTFFVLFKWRIFIPKHISLDFHCMNWINIRNTTSVSFKLILSKIYSKTRLNRACLTIWIAGWHLEYARSSSGRPQKIPRSIVICWSYKRRQRSR